MLNYWELHPSRLLSTIKMQRGEMLKNNLCSPMGCCKLCLIPAVKNPTDFPKLWSVKVCRITLNLTKHKRNLDQQDQGSPVKQWYLAKGNNRTDTKEKFGASLNLVYRTATDPAIQVREELLQSSRWQSVKVDSDCKCNIGTSSFLLAKVTAHISSSSID